MRDDDMSLVCASLTAKDLKGLIKAARTGKTAGADMVELRLDHLEDCGARDLSELKRMIDLPAIVTVRRKTEGGRYGGSEGSRIRLLERAIALGFEYVDLELAIGPGALDRLGALCRERGVKSIVSFHDLARTPDVEQIVHKMRECARAGDIAKVAYAALSLRDSSRIIEAAQIARKNVTRFIVIGMGEPGRITRMIAPFIGSEIAYASLDGRRGTAKGQPGVKQLGRIWGTPGERKGVTPSTALYGLIGFPLGHSLSPAMHNAAFRALGLDAFYMPFEVREGSLEGTVLALKAAGLRGANVTIPYKERIMAHLDGLDEDARRIGAVNTILNRDGALTGYNTDVRGFIDALQGAGVRLDNARAVIIGAGGAARAAAYGLLKQNARVTVANRTRKRALALRRHLGGSGIVVVDLKALEKVLADADILVNCTPAGMHGFASKSPVHGGHIRRDMTVMDMVYNPVRTPLLRLAEIKGARAISGLEMFIRQGIESLRLWTGRAPPVGAIRRALADSQDWENRD